MRSLDAQLDEAKIASGEVRTVKEFAETGWARDWLAVRRVSDRAGGEIRIPGRPWHFDDEVADDEQQFVARQGDNNAEILAELGYSPAEIAALRDTGALIEPQPAATANTDVPAAGERNDTPTTTRELRIAT
jgi:crotonobetainyl-CoA:carnitine CoA-transferase CaiB-like acyl-CoA transferase